jgi:acyl-CoA synthetase (AMP-forming)/AMP-acid ligase II
MRLRSFTVYDIYHRNATLFGTRPALVSRAETIDFSALKTGADDLALRLAGHGIRKGDRIAILALNHPRFFDLFGAAARLGAVVVPLNWRLAAEEIRHILEDAAPSLLVFDHHQAELASQVADAVPATCRLTRTDPGEGPCLDDLEEGTVADEEVVDTDPYCIIYTAAMEGVPRGAVLTHGNLVAANLQTMATMELGRTDAFVNMLPLFHITGLNLSLATLHAGGRNIILDKFDAAATLEAIGTHAVTLMASFPPILSSLLEAADGGSFDLSSLRHVMGIDAPDLIEAFEAKSGAAFWSLYGQTETSGLVSFARRSEQPASAGRVGMLTTVRIVDDNEIAVPTGEKGEITVQGPLVFAGFWNQEKLNRFTFRNGWHHTGDLGSLDEKGYLYFGGRKPEKELIKPGGENVYPAEVEKVILDHPDVVGVSVIGVPDPRFGEGIKAVCVLAEGAALTSENLIAFVADRIARYKKPRYVQFVRELPLNEDGSVDRDAVKAVYGKA